MGVPEILDEMAKTFRERGKVYGNNFELVGNALRALFPHGLWLRSDAAFNRFAILSIIVTKLSRYSSNFESGGHQDSIHDAAVYAAILEHLDEQAVPVSTEDDEIPFEKLTCEMCHGDGKYLITGSDLVSAVTAKCENCAGTGYLVTGKIK